MPLPAEPFTITGGCNCKAIRYEAKVPTLLERPLNCYLQGNPGAAIGQHAEEDLPRLPFVVTCHCNDCRRANAAMINFAIPFPLDMVVATLQTRSGLAKASDYTNRPVRELFSMSDTEDGSIAEATYLTSYLSSAGRRRFFCSRCGTPIAYIAYGGLPVGWTVCLDVWYANMDREFLEKDYMRPERQLWYNLGVPWVQHFSVHGFGAGGPIDGKPAVPRHPLSNMSVLVEDSK